MHPFPLLLVIRRDDDDEVFINKENTEVNIIKIGKRQLVYEILNIKPTIRQILTEKKMFYTFAQ